jgi:chloramphenicol-sensitive protein RarD
MAADSRPAAPTASGDSTVGFAFGIAAYGLWGVIPLYFKLLVAVPPLEVLAHRAWWSFVVLAIGVFACGLRGDVRAVVRRRRTLATLAASATLIGVNWFLYIYAVSTEQIVQAGLGYFITPLANMLIGVLLLKENLRGLQIAALALAATGVALLTYRSGAVPWISVSLATSFSLYAYVRKIAAAEAMVGLFVETLLLSPLALGYLVYLAATGVGVFGPSDPTHSWQLMIGGIVTTIPLLCFAAAVRRLKMTTMGFLQFLSPTLQVLLAVFAFGEAFTQAHVEAFPLILLGVGLYLADAVLRRR